MCLKPHRGRQMGHTEANEKLGRNKEFFRVNWREVMEYCLLICPWSNQWSQISVAEELNKSLRSFKTRHGGKEKVFIYLFIYLTD